MAHNRVHGGGSGFDIELVDPRHTMRVGDPVERPSQKEYINGLSRWVFGSAWCRRQPDQALMGRRIEHDGDQFAVNAQSRGGLFPALQIQDHALACYSRTRLTKHDVFNRAEGGPDAEEVLLPSGLAFL